MGNQLAEEYWKGGLKNKPLLEIGEANKFESLALIPLEEEKQNTYQSQETILA